MDNSGSGLESAVKSTWILRVSVPFCCGMSTVCSLGTMYAHIYNTTELMRRNQTLTREICYYIEKTCGGTWGWRRAVYLDMTYPNTNCPSGWNMTGYSKRTCGRATDGYMTCDSVFFPVSEGPYSQVCGRIRAYQ